jgi:flagellar hook assembly protein FlgD
LPSAVFPPPGDVWIGGTSGRLPVYPGKGEEAIISLNLQEQGRLRIKVASLLWEEIATVFDGDVSAGPLGLRWNGRNQKGQQVAAGTYLVRFEIPGQKAVIKRVVIGR